MSDTPVVPLPPSYDWGFVVGRSISAMADTIEDWDRYPEARGSNGRVTFTPHTRYKKELSGPTAFVHFEVVTARIENGSLVDAQGEEGIYLISGAYKVAFTIDSGSIPGFDILVTPDHTLENPLDLVTAAPFVPEEGTPVTTAVIPAGAAEDQVIGWRNGRLVWIDGLVQIEAAAARAEAAATAAEEWKPEFTWSGTNLVIDGVSGPDLKGETGNTDVSDELDGLRTDLTNVFQSKPVWGSSAQLNDLTTPGSYRLNVNSAGSLDNNFPIDRGPNPVIEVDNWGVDSNVIQTVKYPRDYGFWMRAYRGGMWHPWENISPIRAGERLSALEYDSGLIDITELFSDVTRGTITVQRLGLQVFLNFYDVQIGTWTSGNVITLTDRMPSGFRPPAGQFHAFATVSTAKNAHWVRVLPAGDIAIYYIDDVTRINGSTSYITPDPEPGGA